VMWLWPWMTVGTTAAAPAGERAGPVPNEPATQRAPERTSAAEETDTFDCVTSEFRQTSRSALLHVTTTLSRTWDDLSRLFGRMRDAVAYERLMHASFGWALSPLQRLMPSATWPAIHMQEQARRTQPQRGVGAPPAGDMFALASAWWRGFAAPCAPNAAGQRETQGGAPAAALAFAPMFGAAAMIPAMAFGAFL